MIGNEDAVVMKSTSLIEQVADLSKEKAGD